MHFFEGLGVGVASAFVKTAEATTKGQKCNPMVFTATSICGWAGYWVAKQDVDNNSVAVLATAVFFSFTWLILVSLFSDKDVVLSLLKSFWKRITGI